MAPTIEMTPGLLGKNAMVVPPMATSQRIEPAPLLRFATTRYEETELVRVCASTCAPPLSVPTTLCASSVFDGLEIENPLTRVKVGCPNGTNVEKLHDAMELWLGIVLTVWYCARRRKREARAY